MKQEDEKIPIPDIITAFEMFVSGKLEFVTFPDGRMYRVHVTPISKEEYEKYIEEKKHE